nr:ComF family protein [candidate division Zixibacteria bacterium]
MILRKTGLYDLLDFVFPPICLGCDEFNDNSDELVCDRCWKRIEPIEYPFCLNCHEILPRGGSCGGCPAGETLPVFALGHFVDPLKKIIHHFKYHGYRKLGIELAGRLVDRQGALMAGRKIEAVIPIPLHSYRHKSRGFNQAAIMSDIIGERLNVPVDSDSLVKIRRTRDQARLRPAERDRNIRGAFSVISEELKGMRVILVDDVITTGTTVHEASRVLKEAGIKVAAVAAAALAGLN